MSVIVYDIVGGQAAIRGAMNSIETRYGKLKEKMIKQSKTDAEIKKIQTLLAKANEDIAALAPEQLLEKLKEQSTDVLSTVLEQSARNTSNLISNNNYFFEFARDYNNSIGKLLQLADFANRKEGVKIQTGEFNTSLLKSNKIKGQVGRAANALGEIGAIGGDIKISSVLEELLLQNFGKSNNIVIVPTGAKKVGGQTITSDNVVMVLDENGKLIVNLNISNKFNTAYRATSKGTKNSIKMATRTVEHFLQEVNSNQKDYEIALFNFLSYHETYPNGHFERTDFLSSEYNYKKDWRLLRRAISAEMLYGMTKGTGNTIDVNGHQIKDEIHLYAYGDKLFLHNDVIKSAFGISGKKQISPATINLSRRAGWFKNRNWKGRPIDKIIHGEEPEVETQIKKFSIVYNQIINF